MTLTEEIIQVALVAPDDRKAEALRMLKGETPPPPGRPAAIGPLLLGMGAAAKLLGVSRATFWRVLQAGRIGKVELFPGSCRVRREDVEVLASTVNYTKGLRRAVPVDAELKGGREERRREIEGSSQESEFRRQEAEGADGAEKGSGFGVQAGDGMADARQQESEFRSQEVEERVQSGV